MTNSTSTNTTIVSPAPQIVAPLNTSIYICKDCGKVYLELDAEYVDKYPNGAEIAVEQAWKRHVSGECPNSGDHDIVDICPECQEEIWRGDYEYVSRNPNGSDIARWQASQEHQYKCSVVLDKAWASWRRIYGDITPRELLEKVYKEKGAKACFDIASPPDRIRFSYESEYDLWYYEVDEFILDKHSFKGSPKDIPMDWPTWKHDSYPITAETRLVPGYFEIEGVVWPDAACYFRWDGVGVHPTRRAPIKEWSEYTFI